MNYENDNRIDRDAIRGIEDAVDTANMLLLDQLIRNCAADQELLDSHPENGKAMKKTAERVFFATGMIGRMMGDLRFRAN